MAQQKLIIDQANAPEATEKKKRKAPLILAGLGIIALVPVIGSTFAASITLGTGNVEFGQGTRTAAACDSDIGVKLAATVASAAFTNTTLTLTGLDSTNCAGKTLSIRVADNSSALIPLGTTATTTVLKVTIPSSFSTAALTTVNGAATLKQSGTTTDASAFAASQDLVVTFETAVVPTSVKTVLVESTN